MKKILAAGAIALSAFATMAAAAPASATSAVTGRVVVFSTEMEPLATYDNPSGCTKAPLTAHVLVNETDKPVRTFLDPFCLMPSLTVAPGYGAHLAAGTGSFSVDE